MVCTFWYIDALAALGRRDEARALFESMLKRGNRLGMFAEHIDPASSEPPVMGVRRCVYRGPRASRYPGGTRAQPD